MLRWLNPVLVGIYMAGLLLLGLYFSRRQKSTEAYFVASRSVPGWAAGISLLATIITSVTFIAYPGASFSGDWSLITPGTMMLLLPLMAGMVIVPFFRHVVQMTPFEYFGRRFGIGVRLYSSAMFGVGQLAKMAFVLYLLALTMNSITSWRVGTVLLLATSITIVYALIGGLEAIIWADVFQALLLWTGVLLTGAYLFYRIPAPASRIFATVTAAHKLSLGNWKWNLHQATIPVLLLYGFFFYLQKYTADQTVVQRYLAARTDRQAVRGILLGAALCLPVWALFMCLGTLLWAYFRITGEHLPTFIVKGDQVLPYFLSTHLPPGLGGIFLAALFGAGMAMLASDLNCLATVTVEDFYRHWHPQAPDQRLLSVGRLTVALSGMAALLLAWLLAHSKGAALALYYAVNSVVAGGLASIFLLAFLSPRTTRRSIHAGILVNILFTIWATLSSKSAPFLTGSRIRFTWNEDLIGVIGQLALFTVAYGMSLLFDRRTVPDELTLWSWLRKRKAERALPSTSHISKDRAQTAFDVSEPHP